MKNFFLVFLILMAAGLGLSADPINPGDTETIQRFASPRNGATVTETPLHVREWFQKAAIRFSIRQASQAPLYTENIEFLDESVRLICLWGNQYLSGQLTEQDFQTLVAGRIGVLYMRKLRIKGLLVSMAPDRFCMLC
jgi:hypothetical protein